MTRHQLYATAFYEDDLQSEQPTAQRRLARQGRLDATPDAQNIASEPGDRRLEGHFDGQYAEVMARELQELLAAPNIGEVPYYIAESGEDALWRGYYVPERLDEGDRMEPTTGRVQGFNGRLVFEGTRTSYLRELTVRPDTSITNPFGTGTSEQVWLSNTVSRPRWVELPEGNVESATVQATAATEHLTMARFDVTEPSFSGSEQYALVYGIPYDDEWQSDVRVWDDYGRSQSVTDANGTTVDPTWQRVTDPRHDYVGDRVLENGHLRMEPVPSTNSFDATRWNDTNSAYEAVTLGTSDWELLAWDVREVGLSRVTSLTTWRDSTATSTTSELVCELRRGDDEALFYEPENISGSTPAGLVTLLDPIADEDNAAFGETAGLMERGNVPDE